MADYSRESSLCRHGIDYLSACSDCNRSATTVIARLRSRIHFTKHRIRVLEKDLVRERGLLREQEEEYARLRQVPVSQTDNYAGDPFEFPDVCPICSRIHGGPC